MHAHTDMHARRYSFKLLDKHHMGGMSGKSKHWVLSAPYIDMSLMRNPLTFGLSRNAGSFVALQPLRGELYSRRAIPADL